MHHGTLRDSFAQYKNHNVLYFPANTEFSDTFGVSAYAGLRTELLLRRVRIMYRRPSSFALFFVFY